MSRAWRFWLPFRSISPEHGRSSLELAGVSTEMATVLRVTGLGEAFGVRR